jgi:hypothetical protein
MSDAFEYITRVAARARSERAPRVSVSGRVLAQIRQGERAYDPRLALFTAAAATVSVLTVTVFTLTGQSADPDPLTSMIEVSSLLGF